MDGVGSIPGGDSGSGATALDMNPDPGGSIGGGVPEGAPEFDWDVPSDLVAGGYQPPDTMDRVAKGIDAALAKPGQGTPGQGGAGAQPKPGQQPAGQQPAAGQLSGDDLRHAEILGLSKEVVSAFGTPEAFRGFIGGIKEVVKGEITAAIKARDAKWQEHVAKTRQPAASTTGQQPPAGQPPAGQPGKLPFDFSDPNLFDPQFKAMTEHYEARFGEHAKTLEELRGMQGEFKKLSDWRETYEKEQARQRDEKLFSEFDETVSKHLPEESFGKGRLNELGAAAQAARQQLAQHVHAMQQGYERAGKPVPPMEKLVQAAFRAEFPELHEKQLLANIAAKGKERGGQTVTPAPARKSNGQQRTGWTDARESVAKFMNGEGGEAMADSAPIQQERWML